MWKAVSVREVVAAVGVRRVAVGARRRGRRVARPGDGRHVGLRYAGDSREEGKLEVSRTLHCFTASPAMLLTYYNHVNCIQNSCTIYVRCISL